MALFSKEKTTDNVADIYEVQIREIKAERIRLIRQIGEKYIEIYKENNYSGTPFDELIFEVEENEKKEVLVLKQQLASKGLRKCEACGCELPIDSAFCNKCGSKQEDLEKAVILAGKKCPKCGKEVAEDDSFCMECGYKF